MFVIQKTDVASILNSFNLPCDFIGFDLLSYYQQADLIGMIICVYYGQNDKKYIIKLISSENNNIQREHLQAEFSEKVRGVGLNVPRKYKSGGCYCKNVTFCNTLFVVSIEDFLGNDVTNPTPQLAMFLGTSLGRMHEFAYSEGVYIGCGATYKAIVRETATFDRISSHFPPECISKEYYDSILCHHNSVLNELSRLWPNLPKATTHSDLGLLNNVVSYNAEYGIIDFNLAGDEVLISDFLITWYSSIYDFDFINKSRTYDIGELKDAYWNGYQTHRIIHDKERSIIPSLSQFLNGIYFTKYVDTLFFRGCHEKAHSLVHLIDKHYSNTEALVDLSL